MGTFTIANSVATKKAVKAINKTMIPISIVVYRARLKQKCFEPFKLRTHFSSRLRILRKLVQFHVHFLKQHFYFVPASSTSRKIDLEKV